MKNVAILAYEGCWAMGVYTVTDFFRVVSLLERQLGRSQSYSVQILSVDHLNIAGASGHLIQANQVINLDDRKDYDLAIIPAMEGPRLLTPQTPDPQIIKWLTTIIKQNTPLLALTTGAALLAATGLVNGTMLATHWAYVRVLNKRYPDCQFVAHKSFLKTKNIYTTGALNGCFDALLDFITQEQGDKFSQLCATHLLVADPEKLTPLLPTHRNHTDEMILNIQDWIESNYTKAITIQDMASYIGMSERTLKRRFLTATQLSPNRYLQKVRLDKAKKLLLVTNLSVKEVAYEVGYENISFFIKLFKENVGLTPAKWKNFDAP
ncbi:MAG: helix-turn-helix domain-containing protein [Gammaproteobacteria bacterium]|nr:helix-turn-helix domain-containing protein [Gammaproteobacteria bacterium]